MTGARVASSIQFILKYYIGVRISLRASCVFMLTLILQTGLLQHFNTYQVQIATVRNLIHSERPAGASIPWREWSRNLHHWHFRWGKFRIL